MVNQLEGSWPSTVLWIQRVQALARGLGWSPQRFPFCVPEKGRTVRRVSLIFLLRFTIANAISCTICPWSLGDGWPNGGLGLGWMAGFLLGRLEHVPPEPWGARAQCSHTSLWRIHLGTSLRGASLNHDRFVDVSGMIKKSHLGRSQNPVKNPKGVGRAILIGASHAKWQLRPRSS